MLGHSFVDGKIVETKDARVPIDDVGFLRCYAIYEGITSVGTKPVFLPEHLDRLERSAKLIGLSLPYTREEMRDIIHKLAGYVTTPRGDIRLVQTGGRSDDGLTPPEKGSFYAIANDMKPLPSGYYENGIKVILHEHQRFLPECKTTHYTTAAMLQGKKREAGAIEILYTKSGNLLEAATCNVFLVKNGVLITPEINILHGITRMKMLEIAERDSYTVLKREVSLEEMNEADEIFLSSSYKDVLPVTTIDEKKVADGKVGEVTKQFISKYQDLLKSSVE